MRTTNTAGRRMTFKTLGPFFAIAFGLSWGLGVLFVTVPKIEQVFGPMGYTNPLFILMVWAPAFAGMGLVIGYHGFRGLGRFLRRLVLWRMSAAWWALLLLGVPATFYLGAIIKGTFPAPFPFSPWHTVFPALATALVIGPIEEFGWRGVALPLLQRRLTPFVASLVLGAIWAVWHLPAFFMSGTPQSGWSFGSFFLGVMAITLILTPMFNAARGSLLVAFVFHFMMNNPIWPDAQPWDSLLFTLVAAVVVVVNRKTMFARGAGVTEVLFSPTRPGKANGRSEHQASQTGG
jgi:membrane protease YdiL (CAAX protease family)